MFDFILQEAMKYANGEILFIALVGSRSSYTYNDNSDYDFKFFYKSNNDGRRKHFLKTNYKEKALEINIIEIREVVKYLTHPIIASTFFSTTLYCNDKFYDFVLNINSYLSLFRQSLFEQYVHSLSQIEDQYKNNSIACFYRKIRDSLILCDFINNNYHDYYRIMHHDNDKLKQIVKVKSGEMDTGECEEIFNFYKSEIDKKSNNISFYIPNITEVSRFKDEVRGILKPNTFTTIDSHLHRS